MFKLDDRVALTEDFCHNYMMGDVCTVKAFSTGQIGVVSDTDDDDRSYLYVDPEKLVHITNEAPAEETWVVRTFGTGATRDLDENKLDFEQGTGRLMATKSIYYPRGAIVRCLKDGAGNGFTKGEAYTLREDFHGISGDPFRHMKFERDDTGSPNGWCNSNFEPVNSVNKASPPPVLGTQIGGDHYTRQKIQPITYIWANDLGFSEGNVVKYVTRWKYKGGIKDLEKAHHHLALLIEETKQREAEGVKYGAA